ncbi:hypothetical protein [Phycicoccus sonneratiae]|uniref:Polyketide cyclase / dehydrase and lipid transport n=1 Tax=Phycicoccus sonneratiae TaxID=2807628 RepID=A0ABS2CKM9_9MICO|nr:hypothetical protein [Phycicoccus sonneraticus]MBM6400441.1 hypothetical protein [Phycicoccus sonneraticus]
MHIDLRTTATPELVRRAFTDFTDRRLRTWHRTLDPATYELRGLGPDWAEAREGSRHSPVWVVCRYDWSHPDVVSWVFTETSYGGGGDGWVRATPDAGGGSRVRAEWTSTDVRRQHLVLLAVHRTPVHRMIQRQWAPTLDEYAAAEA